MTSPIKSKLPVIVFLLSILTCAFWCLGQLIDVYRFALVGAIFELLWLPMILLLVGLPILSLINWVKEKYSPKSLYLYSFLILLVSFLFLVLKN